MGWGHVGFTVVELAVRWTHGSTCCWSRRRRCDRHDGSRGRWPQTEGRDRGASQWAVKLKGLYGTRGSRHRDPPRDERRWERPPWVSRVPDKKHARQRRRSDPSDTSPSRQARVVPVIRHELQVIPDDGLNEGWRSAPYTLVCGAANVPVARCVVTEIVRSAAGGAVAVNCVLLTCCTGRERWSSGTSQVEIVLVKPAPVIRPRPYPKGLTRRTQARDSTAWRDEVVNCCWGTRIVSPRSCRVTLQGGLRLSCVPGNENVTMAKRSVTELHLRVRCESAWSVVFSQCSRYPRRRGERAPGAGAQGRG